MVEENVLVAEDTGDPVDRGLGISRRFVTVEPLTRARQARGIGVTCTLGVGVARPITPQAEAELLARTFAPQQQTFAPKRP